MNNYLIILFGWILGQLTFTTISAYLLQRNLTGIDFKKAFVVFIKKETGNYAVAICALLGLMFMLSDYIDPNITRQDLLHKEVLSFKEKAIVYSRTFSFIFGIFCQFILLVLFKRGINGIKDYAQKNNIEDPTKTP